MRGQWGIVLGLAVGGPACGLDNPPVEGSGASSEANTEESGNTPGAGTNAETANTQGGEPSGGTPTGTPGDDASGGMPADSGGGTAAGTGTTSDTGRPVEESLRWIALGDSGEGNDNQMAVAAAAEVVCADQGCDFALLLGDNFYDEGVTAVDDPQFAEKFENIYAGLDMPFYIVLGNHDYGELAFDWARGDYQVQYGEMNEKWVMPHFWYTFTSETAATQFFAFDTQRIMFDHQTDLQRDWLSGELEASTAPWKIGFAHHPYVSNGKHGNAGNYEGLPGLALINGTYIKEFMDELVCGQMQVYFSGHDHNRQAFDPVCGTYFFVSGAAAKTTDFENRDDNPLAWGDDQRPGFVWAEIENETFTAAFFDLDGNLDHEMTFTL
ncbi:MAG: metallophosphoesterase [Myxococcota bacterium]